MIRLKSNILVIAAALALSSAANAHPQLKAAGPAPGSVVKAPPKALRIQFNEGIVLGFSGIEVANDKGQKLALGDASLDPDDNKQLLVPLKSDLAPGKYTVTWHAVGDDTHKVEGKYAFEVKP